MARTNHADIIFNIFVSYVNGEWFVSPLVVVAWVLHCVSGRPCHCSVSGPRLRKRQLNSIQHTVGARTEPTTRNRGRQQTIDYNSID